MQTKRIPQNRVRHKVNNLLIAEMFLLQATIESAAAIGDRFNEMGRHAKAGKDSHRRSWESIYDALQRIADVAVEPYSSHYRYYRDVINDDN